MKRLHVINSLNIGGAEKLIVDNVPYYEEMDLAVDVLSLADEESFLKENLLSNTKAKNFGLTKRSLYNPLLIFHLNTF